MLHTITYEKLVHKEPNLRSIQLLWREQCARHGRN